MGASRPRRVERPLTAARPTEVGLRRRVSPERRRREAHFRRRRRDLLVDTVAALALAVFLISATAGLGVVALLEVPIGSALGISLIAERWLARKRRRASR